jgi:transposase
MQKVSRARQKKGDFFKSKCLDYSTVSLFESSSPGLIMAELLDLAFRDSRLGVAGKEGFLYPDVARLKQVGPLIALTYLLTLDNPHRFRRSRDVGCCVGLRPGRRNSGKSEPQLHISKEGDRYIRTLLVQGAHYILGPFGPDSDLRRWGLRLSERGGRNVKKRAVVAVARKLA